MSKKIAIIQNRFQKGGRMQVTVKITEILNEMGIIPDLVCFKSNITKKEVQSAYNSSAEFNFREIAFNPRIPFEWNILLFNVLSGRYLSNYDLVINSNNTSFLLRRGINMISYVHFPRKARIKSPKKDIHFPEGPNKSFLNLRSDPLKLATLLYSFDTSVGKTDFQVCNSEFTKRELIRSYSIEPDSISVIYPPVITESQNISEKNPDLVVSLGRFSPDKRQLEQVRIAEKLPELTFRIIGFVNSETYFKQIQDYIATRNITNVELLPNADFDQINDSLNKALFFIHNLRNEPFGITTVQAIQAGCIPIVHNSGGQTEIVIDESLRYNSADEAIELFKNLKKVTSEELLNKLNTLRSGAHRFSESTFKSEFKALMESRL